MPHKVDIHVGQKLRERRKEISMSQGELGDRLKITFQQIQKYEKGTNRIGASRLFELSTALGVPVSYFFEGLNDEAQGSSDQLDGALSAQMMRVVKAFNEIDDPKMLDNTVHLLEGIAEKAAHCREDRRSRRALRRRSN